MLTFQLLAAGKAGFQDLGAQGESLPSFNWLSAAFTKAMKRSVMSRRRYKNLTTTRLGDLNCTPLLNDDPTTVAHFRIGRNSKSNPALQRNRFSFIQ